MLECVSGSRAKVVYGGRLMVEERTKCTASGYAGYAISVSQFNGAEMGWL